MTDVPEHWVDRLKEVASRLDQVVVSLDRIGSRETDRDYRALMLLDFMEKWGVTRSLSEARGSVYALLEETVDPKGLAEDDDFVDSLGIVELPTWSEEP